MDFPLSLTCQDVLRGQGMDPLSPRALKPSLARAAESALQQGLPLLRPRAWVRQVAVQAHQHERLLLEGGDALTGPLVSRFLSGASQLAAALCTIGPELEGFSSSQMDADPLLALALDGLGNAAVEILAQQVCARLAAQAATESLTMSSPLNPGDPGWPVEVGQPQVFSLLKSEALEVTLTSGAMMVPRKSISFIAGIGPDMQTTDLCSLCSLRERCRYRHD